MDFPTIDTTKTHVFIEFAIRPNTTVYLVPFCAYETKECLAVCEGGMDSGARGPRAVLERRCLWVYLYEKI